MYRAKKQTSDTCWAASGFEGGRSASCIRSPGVEQQSRENADCLNFTNSKVRCSSGDEERDDLKSSEPEDVPCVLLSRTRLR